MSAQIPDLFRYRDMVLGQNMPDPAAFPSLAEFPVYVRFREHHCISPEVPVPIGGTNPGFDDGVLNAYLPQNFDYRHVRNGLRISIPGSTIVTHYEDYVQGKPNSHDPTTCSMCASRVQQDTEMREHVAEHTRAAAGEAVVDDAMHDDFAVSDSEEAEVEPVPRARRGSASSHNSHGSYWYGSEHDSDGPLSSRQMMLDDDPDTEALLHEMMTDGLPDDYEEYVENECSGIQDIIITGEVRRFPICEPVFHIQLSSLHIYPRRLSAAMARPGTTTASTGASVSGTASSSLSACPSPTTTLGRLSFGVT